MVVDESLNGQYVNGAALCYCASQTILKIPKLH